MKIRDKLISQLQKKESIDAVNAKKRVEARQTSS